MLDFANQVVVITGAAGNLGQAVVEAFHGAGARLTLVDRSPDRLQKMFKALADSAKYFLAQSVDVTDAHSIENMVAETVKRFGRIDVLVNAAGGASEGIRSGQGVEVGVTDSTSLITVKLSTTSPLTSLK
ncbi:MAG TPA: SDR family NAD(P)-dependent oxidoreductase [Pyrinomonadaceae bacterium]|nr:SDR family NAD(P)-dependent oxidoreductase [Pyrinomonadaceae bacterium]